MMDFLKEISQVLDAFDGGVGVPREITEFISLSQKLQHLFQNSSNLGVVEDGYNSEELLLHAIKLCISRFRLDFEADVLCQVFATETNPNDYDSIVHPAYQVLERLLSTASDQAKHFNDDFLRDQIHQSVSVFFGYVPSLNPPRLEGLCDLGASDANDHPLSSPSANTFLESRLLSNDNSRSSALTYSLNTPPIAQLSQDWPSTPSKTAINDSLSTPRPLATDMDVNRIISSGLGLSGGHREWVRKEGGENPSPHLDQTPPSTSMRGSLDESPSKIYSNDAELLGNVQPKRRVSAKVRTGRQRTASGHANPNKENLRMTI